MDLNILGQIREKYRKAAETYGEKFFNLKDLESRITHLLKTGGSLELFAKGEMDFYNKAMSIAKNRQMEILKKEEAGARIAAILSANEEKIKKYRDIYFDPAVSLEIRKIVGALTDWFDTASPLIKYLFRGADTWAEIVSVEAELERFYIPAGRAVPVFLRHFTGELKNMGAAHKEKAEKKILQTCANSLYKMEKILIAEMEKLSPSQKERLISMSAAFEPGIRDKWNKYREYDALQKCIAQLSAIIDDFRLRDLSALGYKNLEVKE